MKNKLAFGLVLLSLVNPVSAQGIDRVYQASNLLSFGQVIRNTFNLSNYNKSYAVVVGISEYAGGFTNLPSTRNDAIRMKDYLINEAGFDYVHLITEERATLARLQNVMVDKIPRLVGVNDRFVFYWSGHGVTRTANRKPLGYLPIRNSIKDEFSTMLRMRALADWDDALQAKQTLYLLDACFSGLAGFAAKGHRNQTIQQIAKPSRQILTAGLPHEETIASAAFGGSLFTTAIIDGLKGEADVSFGRYPKDGIISAKELELYAKRRVNDEISQRRLGRRLTPSLLNLPGGRGDFFFVNNEYVEDTNAGLAIVASSSPVNPKSGAAPNRGPVSHYHAANQYSNALTHSHPGGGVPHPHNYGNKAKAPVRQSAAQVQAQATQAQAQAQAAQVQAQRALSQAQRALSQIQLPTEVLQEDVW